jgi:hypothetical protein
VFGAVWDSTLPERRATLSRLFATWGGVFPPDVLERVKGRMLAAPVPQQVALPPPAPHPLPSAGVQMMHVPGPAAYGVPPPHVVSLPPAPPYGSGGGGPPPLMQLPPAPAPVALPPYGAPPQQQQHMGPMDMGPMSMGMGMPGGPLQMQPHEAFYPPQQHPPPHQPHLAPRPRSPSPYGQQPPPLQQQQPYLGAPPHGVPAGLGDLLSSLAQTGVLRGAPGRPQDDPALATTELAPAFIKVSARARAADPRCRAPTPAGGGRAAAAPAAARDAPLCLLPRGGAAAAPSVWGGAQPKSPTSCGWRRRPAPGPDLWCGV